MISPVKLGSSKLTTSSCTGPMVMLNLPLGGASPGDETWGGNGGAEDLLLLGVELGLSQHACIEKPLGLHQLLVGVRCCRCLRDRRGRLLGYGRRGCCSCLLVGYLSPCCAGRNSTPHRRWGPALLASQHSQRLLHAPS